MRCISSRSASRPYNEKGAIVPILISEDDYPSGGSGIGGMSSQDINRIPDDIDESRIMNKITTNINTPGYDADSFGSSSDLYITNLVTKKAERCCIATALGFLLFSLSVSSIKL